MLVKYICDAPVFENGKLAFGACLDPGGIGCLCWMSDVSAESCLGVLREAKACLAAGLYLPGIGHVPDFPVDDNDVLVNIPMEHDSEVQGGILRCVLFDVSSSKIAESSKNSLPITIEFEPKPAWVSKWRGLSFDNFKHPLIRPDDHIRQNIERDYNGDLKQPLVCADRRVEVTPSALGLHVELDTPIVFVNPCGSWKARYRIAVKKKGYTRVSDAAFDWPKHYLSIDEYCVDNMVRLTMFDVKDGWRGYARFNLRVQIGIFRGFYIPSSDEIEWDSSNAVRWGDREPSDVQYESLFGMFNEVLTAGVIQRAWRQVSCNPHHQIGKRILHKEAVAACTG